MAVFKSVKRVSKNYSGLKRVLDYVTREKDKEKRDKEVFKITGFNCSDNSKDCYKEFVMCKEIHDNTKGRQYRHHIQSFKIGEVTPEMAHEIAQKFAEENYKGFQVLVVTHIDKKHIHNHFIVNSVNMETGRKFRELNDKEIEAKEQTKSKYESHEFSLEKLKESSDVLCAERGLSVIDRTQGVKSINIYDKNKYHVYKNHVTGKEKSYKIELAKSIVSLSERCTSKDEFIAELKKQNIDVEWKDSRKHVVFKFIQKPGEKKKRNIRLETLKKDIGIDIFDKEKLMQTFQENHNFEVEYNKKKEIQEQQELERQRRIQEEQDRQRYLEQIRQAELRQEKANQEKQEKALQHQQKIEKIKAEQQAQQEKKEVEETIASSSEVPAEKPQKPVKPTGITIPKKSNHVGKTKTTYDYDKTTKKWSKKVSKSWGSRTKGDFDIDR